MHLKILELLKKKKKALFVGLIFFISHKWIPHTSVLLWAMHKICKNKWKKAESVPFLCTETWGLALAHLHNYLSEGRQVFE